MDSEPLIDNPFVEDASQLKAQLNALKAAGGGDEPESLLDALYMIATMEQTAKGTTPCDPQKWRCAHARPLVLVCVQTGRELRMNIETAVGRGLLRALGSDESIFASEPQFFLRPDLEHRCWVVQHAVGAVNATFLNGAPLAALTPLQTGAVLSLGLDKLKLSIRFEV